MIQIAGITIATPSEFNIGRFYLSKSARSASGRMNMDIIAEKRRVDCKWAGLRDSQLQQILTLLDTHKPFFTFTYPDTNGNQIMTCYAGDRVSGLWDTTGAEKIWEEVSISFIER